ncbi:hypothetical protein DFJ43DRAFT_1159263 [Lentinula guzmanii]|uniref:Rrn9 domain-containing protein n=1 Tax=Lentinula guzmanii TaxID=2804957 RepID=A0AA38JFH0_9AGAR|nr:hypothetical protein DFJ43DRAFT_1159263 [Lentinula guzmanii]
MSSTKDRLKSQHKRIPAALHSELSEYTSLLRAIRTTDTLDVTSQLTRYFNDKVNYRAPSYESNEDDEDYTEAYDVQCEDAEEGLAPDSDAELIRRTNSSSAKRKRASQSQSSATEEIITTRKKTSSRETWTRWPLLAQDVPAPEWSLQDEVAHITALLLRDTTSSTTDLETDNGPDHETNPSIPQLNSSLTLSSSRYLDSILASLAAVIPKRSASMINRLAPAGWQSVLAAAQILAASQATGSVSTKTLERVQRRLEDLYGGPSTPRPVLASPGRNVANAEATSSGVPATSSLSSQPSTSSASIPPLDTQTHTSSPPRSSPSLSNHRIRILHASSSKLSTAFSSYGAAPTDLRSLEIDYPGIGFSLPEGWAKNWYANRAQEKMKKKGRRKKREGNKNQVLEVEDWIKPRKKSNRKGKGKQVDHERMSKDDNAMQDGQNIGVPDDNENGSGYVDVPNVDGGGQEEPHLTLRPGKRTRSGQEDEGASSDDSGYPPTKKRKTARRKSQKAQTKSKPKRRYTSAKFIDCD